MIYAVISDIHGNLEALTAVMDDIAKIKADAIYCLGDIVGYYTNPNECLEIVKTKCSAVIIGNHEWAALGKIDIEKTFTYYALTAMQWTRKNISKESLEYISNLPLTYKTNNNILLTHSGPGNTNDWDYIFMDSEDAIYNAFALFKEHICFYAHTHQSAVLTQHKGNIVLIRGSFIKIEDEHQYLVNVGSVGQPRDLDKRACYVIYDDVLKTLTIKRVDYDFKTTQEKMKLAGLPDYLGLRLSLGR